MTAQAMILKIHCTLSASQKSEFNVYNVRVPRLCSTDWTLSITSRFLQYFEKKKAVYSCKAIQLNIVRMLYGPILHEERKER